MCEHEHLPAMVGFVSKHVAEHLRANWPRLSPAVSAKLLDAAPRTAERFSEHLGAASGALGQSRTGLLRRAVRAVELWWNLQVRSGKPDPLGADIVHVGEDRSNVSCLAGRFGWRFCSPRGRVKMLDKNLVHAIVGGKDLDCGAAELSVNLGLTRGHGSYSLTYSTSGPSATCTFRRLARSSASQKPPRGSKGTPHAYDSSVVSPFGLYSDLRKSGVRLSADYLCPRGRDTFCLGCWRC
jgi:hypothetical protein